MDLKKKFEPRSLEDLNKLNDPVRDIENPCPRTKEIFSESKLFRSEWVMNKISERPAIGSDRFTDVEMLITLLTRETYEQLAPHERDTLSKLLTEYCVKSSSELIAHVVYSRGPYHTLFPTYERLRSMFPHMAMPEKIKSILSKIVYLNINPQLQPFFYLPEFGGLIPTEKLLKRESREALIILHLFAIDRLKELPIPLHMRHIILKSQLENSLLSDDRRLHQLVSLDLIYGGGDLTPETQAALFHLNQRDPNFSKHVNFKALT